MDLDILKKLIKMVEKSRVNEIEIEEGGKRIRISKGPPPPPPAVIQEAAVPQVPASPQQVSGKTDRESPIAEDTKLHTINSELVGTFYRAPAEDSEPFVKEGDIVNKGDTVCIIEAMKIMNEIESDIHGKIVQVLPENGSPVEYGEPLFKIEPL